MKCLPEICGCCELEPLIDGYVEHPFAPDGINLCQDCESGWRLDNEDECPVCANYFLEDELTDWFVIRDELGGHPPGIYYPVRYPIYQPEMLGSDRIYWDNVRYFCPLPRDSDGIMMMCAWICEECQGKIMCSEGSGI